MEGEDSSGPALYRSCNQSCDGIATEPIDEVDDSRLVGVPAMVDDAGGGGASAVVDVELKAEVNGDGCGGNRKRGRPPRGQAKQPPVKKKKEEEDVCFICFDGGSLVLCDRRGCPKAYHPACIKRDEAFFRSKAKWNCGWHICSICHKAAHYMCYTCTYSLCKACTKDADYLRVRENKGFCTTCMRTIMLIENNDQGNKEMLGQAQVDFDDKSSWEYLFKVYWIYLKENLSLTLDELTQAKNPWKAAGTVACKEQSLDMHYGGGDRKCSILDSPSGHLEANDSKRRRTRQQPKLPNYEDSLSTDKSSSDKVTTSTGSTEWASKELLDLVAHMKNGDTSVLSQFDVQGLLLDYIKRNNLRDPHQKSQIICDLRLKTLFGKPRVGHIEMLKLLEFHFLIKEDSQKDVIQGNVVDAVLSQVEGGGNNENLLMIGKDKKRKTRRKGEERGLQTNLDEYAAIDVHNINLIYLRRNLMESLFADKEKFHDKVVGSIVRIRISSSDQKQDMYRLVQVVGTCKAAVPYKTGEKTADVMLKILNLDKKETISIDGISNQEFSEDECRRLRQSIKCGLVKLLTVGQVREKAVAFQEVRLNDYLRLLSEESGDTSSEITDKELALSKSVDAMARSMETTPSDIESKTEKHREYEQECRQKFSNEIKSDSEVENMQFKTQPESDRNTVSIEQATNQSGSHMDEKPLEEVTMLSHQRKVTVMYVLLSACLADIPEDNKKSNQRRKGYDARHRVALRLLTTWFDIKWDQMEAIETMVAFSAMALAKEEQSKEEETQSPKSTWAKWKRGGIIGAAALTGGTLLAITGGLAAPAIAAGLGALAPTLGTLIPVIGASGFAAAASAAGTVAGSVAVAASFGAAGAGLTGSKMARRTGSVDEFEFKSIGENHNQGRLAVEIFVSGFVFEEEDFVKPWEGQHDNLERYALQWESKNLIAVSTAIQDWLTSRVAMELMRTGAMMTVLSALLTALAWPATLLAATDFIDSKWSIAVDRSDKAGMLLAEALQKGLQGQRPVTLVGFSLGARVIYKCLEVLAESNHNAELVERVVLLGAPIAIKDENWEAARNVVAGRFVNAYSTNDWMLGLAFRASLLTKGLAGIQPVDVPGIENVDVTGLVEGHSSYLWATQQILEQLELEAYYPVFSSILIKP